MKKSTCLILKMTACVFMLYCITGCWDRRELNSLGIVMAFAIDKAEEPGKIEITAQILKPSGITNPQSGGGGSGGGSKAYFNLKNTGNTVFSILRGFTHKMGRRLYMSHNKLLIFGQSIAEEGIQKHIDFFFRDHEPRPDVLILIAKGNASRVLEIEPLLEKIPGVGLSEILEGQGSTSQTAIIPLNEFLNRLMSKTTAPIAPMIERGEGKSQEIKIWGTGVFKKDKLIGQLNLTETRGLLWVLNKVKSGILDVECSDGRDKVSIEISRAKSRITPEIKDGNIHMKVKIEVEGKLGGQMCPENLTEPLALEALKGKTIAGVKNEIMSAVKKARQLNADIFGFGEDVYKKYPKVWKGIEDKWEEIFPQVGVEPVVEVSIEETGALNQPPSTP